MQPSMLFLLLFVLTALASCQQKPVAYIIPVHPEGIYAEAMKDGITEYEGRNLSILLFDSVYRNTVGRKLPSITVRNLQHKTLNLQDAITEKTMILSGDIHCGFGRECLENTFPAAVNQLQKAGFTVPIICLLVKTPYDYEDSTAFNTAVKDLSPVYKNILIIDEAQAFKINAISSSTRYFVTKDLLISDISFGNCTPPTLSTEMKQFAYK